MTETPEKIEHIGRGQHPNTAKNLEGGRNNNRREAKKRKEAFLVALTENWPNVSRACKLAGVPRNRAYAWKDSDKKLAQKWLEIEESKLDELEKSAFQASQERGGAGYAFPILRAYRRERWGEKIDHNVKHSVELTEKKLQELKKKHFLAPAKDQEQPPSVN